MQRVIEVAKRHVRGKPFYNALLSRVLYRYRILAVRHDTEIVIEGFPRCANTFSVTAFEKCQTVPRKIAHHLHSLGQVRRGVQLGLPCLILTRSPRDAVLSLAVRKQLKQLAFPLEEYIEFYIGIVELSDSVIIADFHEVTTDYGEVIDRLNRRFGTNFDRFEHTPENVEACYETIENVERGHSPSDRVRSTHVARPSKERQMLKQLLVKELEQGPTKRLLEQASDLYQQLLELQAVDSKSTH